MILFKNMMPIPYFQKAAFTGSDQGMRYRLCKIEQDDQICGMWMKRAAENGHVRAQYMLGRMYELGLGMRADPVQAYKWYTLSGNQGYRMSQTGAKNMLEIMTPQQRAEAKKLVAESEKK